MTMGKIECLLAELSEAQHELYRIKATQPDSVPLIEHCASEVRTIKARLAAEEAVARERELTRLLTLKR
jgi:hypothetical protein